MRNSISFQITTWNASEFRPIFGIRTFQFQFTVILLIRECCIVDSVIEEPSFHLLNVVVRIDFSCSDFQQLARFSLRIYFRLWVY